ncbi:MAG: PaaX family transcriptional regulator C-terminal domain-containing protein [Patescibacteria group bacterium]
MRSKELGKILLHASEGLISTTTDLVLFLTILPFALPGAYTQGEVSRRVEDVMNLVSRDLNYRTIKNTVRKLIAAGLITKRTKRSSLDIAITKLGKERIASLIPTYHEDRPWDGHMYLVSYDVPAKPKRKRDMLREYLRRIGSVLLQESLWLTPYNPRDLVDDFIRQKEIGGSILISKLGTDGAIGDESLLDLIGRVYRLDALNERYAAFLETWENHKSRRFSFQATTAYLSILNDDPQLPFPLLPKDFLGMKAFHLYQSLSNNVSS